jgi:hypothetical protein
MPEMSEYLTSEEALEVLCKNERPDFLRRALNHVITMVIVIAGSMVIWKVYMQPTSFAKSIYPYVTLGMVVIAGYFIVLGMASVIMHWRPDGKYWGKYVYEPCWYNCIDLFQKRIIPVKSLTADLKSRWGKTVLINGAIIAKTGDSSTERDRNEEYITSEDSYPPAFKGQCTVEYNNEICLARYKLYYPGYMKAFEEQPLLITGKISFEGIVKMKLGTVMRRDGPQHTAWFYQT